MFNVNYDVFIATDLVFMRFMQLRKRLLCVFHSTLFLGTVQICVTVRVSVILYVFILGC